MATNSLAALDGQFFQKNNQGGVKNIFIALARDIVGDYPLESQISADKTEVTALPVMVTGKKFSHYLFPDGTAEYTGDDSGDPDFQSDKVGVEFMLAGVSKAVRAEVMKLKNAGVIVIIQDKSNNYVLLGTKDDPIYLKKSFKGGKKGNDKRGYTLKGEVDGLAYGILTLDPTLLATFTVNSVAV